VPTAAGYQMRRVAAAAYAAVAEEDDEGESDA
jgi:hypothetical protein